MDFQSAMETFAEAWVAANTGKLALIAAGANGSSSSSPGMNAGGTTVTSSMGNPMLGPLGVGHGAAEQMSLAVAGSLIQQQLGKGVVVGGVGNNSGSCSSNSSPSSGGGIGIGSGAGVVSSSTTSGESALLMAAAAAASAAAGSIGSNNAVVLSGLDYPSKLQSANIGSMPSSVSASVMGSSITSGMDLSPPSKRLKTGVSSMAVGGGGGTSSLGNGTIMGATIGAKKISHAFQHAHHHPGLPAGFDVGDLVDPAGLLAGQHLSLGKSLPIHCVIEVINGPGDSSIVGGRGDRGRDGSGKSETSSISTLCGSSSSSALLGGGNNGQNSPGNCSGNTIGDGGKIIEVDEFVIIPAGTPFQEVVTTVLTLLGYPKDTIQQAVGMISLRNWKPLRLDQVCDSPHKTVGDILNDLTNHATLRVLVTRAKGGTAEDLKEKLLRLLLAQSSSLLLGSGCPLDEVTLSQLMKGQWPQNLAEDVKRRFDQWYATHFQQRLGSLESLQQLHQHHQQPQPQQQQPGSQHHPHHHLAALNHSGHQHGHGSSTSNSSRENGGGLSSPLSSHHHHAHLVNGANGGNSLSSMAAAAAAAAAAHHHQSQHLHHHHDLHPTPGGSNKSSAFDDDHPNHPVFHGLTTQKTRMRTSFDPEMELPKLQQWFADNPHPSRHQIQQYVRDLNSLDCRKDRKPLDVNNVIYWFKNARAAQKRNELRYNGLAAFPHPLHHQHHHHQSQMSAIHLHNQAHNHAISPVGDDSRDDDREEHLRQAHHHLHHHRVPRSLDSDELEGSHDREDDLEEADRTRDRDFAHNNDSGRNSRESSVGLVSSKAKDQADRDSDREASEQLASSSAAARVKRDLLEEKDKLAVGSPDEEMYSDLKQEDLRESESSEMMKKTVVKEEQDDDYISVDVELSEGNNLNPGSPGECCNNNEPKDLSGKSGMRVYDNDNELGVSRQEKGSRSESPQSSAMQGGVAGCGGDEEKKDVMLTGARSESRLTPDPLQQQQLHHHHHQNDVSNHSTSSSISPRSSPGLSPNHSYDFSGAPSMVGRFPNFFEHPSFMAYRHFNSFNFGQNFATSNGGDGSGNGGPVGYESALGMVAASRAKGILAPGKPSPGLDLFTEFQNGMPILPGGGRGQSSALSGSVGGSGDPLARLRGDELCSSRSVSSADIISSIINSNRGDLGMSPLNLGAHHPNQNSLALDERRKRNRTFIDPVTEVPRLEQWFGLNTHPSHNLILKYTDELNRMPYRQKFPKLEPKNVQFWFKNRRAKCKRLKMTL